MNTRGRCTLVVLASIVIGLATSAGSSACYTIGGDQCDDYSGTAAGKRFSRQGADGTFSRTFDDGARRNFLERLIDLQRWGDIREPSAIWLRVTIARPDDAGVHPLDGGTDPRPHLPTEGIATVMRLRYTLDSCRNNLCNVEIDVVTCHSPRQWMEEDDLSPNHDVAPTCWDVSGATFPPLSWTTSGTMQLAKPSEWSEAGRFNVRTVVTVDIPQAGNAKLYGHATITVQDSRECI